MLIIARYNEDISWTKNLTVPFIIYNKGAYIKNAISLPNKGKESDTYLRHIIDNYDTLEGTLFFIQGNPFDHAEGSIIAFESGGFNTSKGTEEDIVHFFNTYKLQDHFMHLGKIYCCDYMGQPHMSIDIASFINNTFKTFPQDIQYLFFVQGAQFAVSAKRIKEKSRDFYIDLLVELHKDEINPHVMERLWMYIFSKTTE
jgi:hypothetical protein